MPTITFRRDVNVDNIPIIDGQIIFDTSRNIILMDNGNVRNQYAGSTQLISTTPQATNTNAYNAVATNQIFLQKTTVVDTKANALAVTQQYIPLGCLAFKEALGTSDFSGVGNGTISGGLVSLNNQLKANGTSMYMDYHDGKYGVNTSPNRGADTFIPFKSATEVYSYYYPNGASANFSCPVDGKMYCACASGGSAITWYPDSGQITTASATAYVTVNGNIVCNGSSSSSGEGASGRYQTCAGRDYKIVNVHQGDIINGVTGGLLGSVALIIVKED